MESFHGHSHRYSCFQGGMWENKNIYGKFPDISLTFLFSDIPYHKCLWKVSMGIPVDILIFRRECGKIKISVESFHRHFHRHLYFPKFLLTNVNGNFA
jgi:hypothetical protein